MESIVTSKDCVKILKKIDEKFCDNDVKKFKLSSATEKAKGYLAIHNILTIETKGGDMFDFFVKSKPTMDEHTSYVDEIKAFEKEYKSYEILLPTLLDISKKTAKAWSPECYLTKTNVIILENLKDYILSTTGHLFDYNHLACALRSLAHFHSSSVIFEYNLSLKIKTYRINELYPECSVESTFSDDKDNVRYAWFHNGVNIVISMASLIEKYNEKQVNKIKTELPKMLDRIRKRFKTSNEHINVFCHGDLWANNIMFKYEDNMPVHCKLVDFQLGRYAPYMTDLLSVIYLTTDRKTRDQYMNDFLDGYRNAFNAHLKNAGLPEDNFILPTDLMNDLKEFSESALLETCLYEMITALDYDVGDVIIASQDNFKEFFYGDRSKFVIPSFKQGGSFSKRMKELIEEFVDDHIL